MIPLKSCVCLHCNKCLFVHVHVCINSLKPTIHVHVMSKNMLDADPCLALLLTESLLCHCYMYQASRDSLGSTLCIAIGVQRLKRHGAMSDFTKIISIQI